MRRHALPYLTAARVAGADAANFLHAQLSSDVTGLTEGGAGFACYCSPRGQVYGLLLVCRREQDFIVAGAAALLSGLIARLRRYVLRSRVELQPEETIDVFGVDDAESHDAAWATGTGLAYGFEPDGTDAALRDSATEWKARELRRGIVWLGPETSERFIPQMLGFDRIGAVSFSKGCYPGQEVIARARYLGKVKRGPLQLLAELPAPSALQRCVAGAGVTLRSGDRRIESTLIDWAPIEVSGNTLLCLVGPVLEDGVQSVEIGGHVYRCATI